MRYRISTPTSPRSQRSESPSTKFHKFGDVFLIVVEQASCLSPKDKQDARRH